MGEFKFINWLNYEVSSAYCALLCLYEEHDRLLYSERPLLEKQYMEKIGHFEEQVIREEIEHELTVKKQTLVQAALNRRGPVDMQSIEAAIDAERQKLLSEAADTGISVSDIKILPSDQMDEMQKLYHEITQQYHPQIHSGLTEVQKELYQRAQDAYRRKDLPALRLIHTMLKSSEDDIADAAISLSFGISTSVLAQTETAKISIGDYQLAALLFDSFVQTAEEAIIHETLLDYKNKIQDATATLENIKSNFPFSASEMLADPEQLAAYKLELEQRLATAKQQTEQRNKLIQTMLQEA